MSDKIGLLCTKCGTETDVTPDDLESLSFSTAKSLVYGWLCNQCLDEIESECDQPRNES